MTAIPPPASSVLVELGAGTGERVLAAACFGFHRVIGVEPSRPACDRAEQRLEDERRRYAHKTARVDILQRDPESYRFEDENIVVLTAPMDTPSLTSVLDRFAKARHHGGQPGWVVVAGPALPLVRHDAFETLQQFRFRGLGGTRATLYGISVVDR